MLPDALLVSACCVLRLLVCCCMAMPGLASLLSLSLGLGLGHRLGCCCPCQGWRVGSCCASPGLTMLKPLLRSIDTGLGDGDAQGLPVGEAAVARSQLRRGRPGTYAANLISSISALAVSLDVACVACSLQCGMSAFLPVCLRVSRALSAGDSISSSASIDSLIVGFLPVTCFAQARRRCSWRACR